MKTYLYSVGFFGLLMLIGCTTGKNTADSDFGSMYGDSSAVTVSSLPDYIRTLPRLSVSGSGDYIQVHNSTAASLGDTRVLFVVDGLQMGRDYLQVANTFINKNQRVEVEFLRMSRATQRYGEAGRNGAILIKTVKDIEDDN